jgi:hypothetical protein
MSAGEDLRRADGKAVTSDVGLRADRREAMRYSLRRPVYFRRRGAMPAPGFLLNISERGALVQVEKAAGSDLIPWPLFLRHGDELWLCNVIREPLACWIVALEHDLIRLRLFMDTDTQPALRELIFKLDIERTASIGGSRKSALGRVR